MQWYFQGRFLRCSETCVIKIVCPHLKKNPQYSSGQFVIYVYESVKV